VRLGLLFGVCAFALVLSGSVVARTNHASANGTMVFAGAADPTYLDPALVSDGESFRVTEQIFEGLVAIRPGTTSIRPALATSWKIARDGKSYVFNLRHNVKFHDGTRFNAKAVCTNFNRWYNFSGPFQDASATYYYQAIFGGFHHNESSALSPPLFKSCTANGNYRVTIRLTRRNGPFLPALSLSAFAIQSPAALAKYGANQGELRSGTFYPTGSYAFSHPTGTGPFKFGSWTVGQRIVLDRFKGYWGKKAKLQRVIIRPIANNEARLQALKTGEINGYDLVAPQDVPTIKRNSKLKVLDRSPFNVAYVGFNQAKPPMNKLKVRQAIAYGLDRKSVVKAFYLGRGKVAQEFMPPGLFGYANNVTKYSYNPSKAKSLLRSAGLSLPVKLDFYYFTRSRAYLPDPTDTFQAFKASLENSGFSITPHVLPFRPDFLSAVNRGDAGHLYMVGWNGDWGDPDDWVGIFFQNYQKAWGFKNAKLFKLLTRAEGEPNFKRRVALYQQANRYIMKFLPGVPFAHNKSAMAAQRRVKNLLPSPVQIERYSLVSLG